MNKFLKRLLLVLITLMLLVFAAGSLLSQGKTLGIRHENFAEASFDYTNGTFADYIRYSRERLQAARLDAPADDVISRLLPFELAPPADCRANADGKAAQGVLLIHGLLDSPYSMRDFGEFLQSQCFYVLGLLLPDHGSRPGDFLNTDWQDWAAATSFATRALSNMADKVIVGGHSAGGALAILEATQNTEVDALMLFAPALAITDAAKYARFIVPLGWLFPKAAWFALEADEAIYRYESIPFTAAAETYALTQAVLAAENTRVQQLPVFTVASSEDNTVSTAAILQFMGRNTHERSVTLLYSQHPAPNNERGVGQDLLPHGEHLRVIPSATPQQGILSVSHLGLMTPPTHPYYGLDGEYRSCSHYGPASNPDFIDCKQGERSFYGEVTAENRGQGIIERISFNPYYDAMLAEVLRFLK